MARRRGATPVPKSRSNDCASLRVCGVGPDSFRGVRGQWSRRLNTRPVASILFAGWTHGSPQRESVGSTIVRQWHLLTLLPKGPRRIDTATLEAQLRARGFEAHRRTIQRDLVELAGVFPIVSDDRSKPYGWRWADHAELFGAFPSVPAAGQRFVPGSLLVRLRRRRRRRRLSSRRRWRGGGG